MLSSDDYFDFSDSVQEIMDECYLGTDSSKIVGKAGYAQEGYTTLTKGKKYYFSNKATEYQEQLIKICNTLPVYPPVHAVSCGVIAYANLLPDDMTSKMELMDACELADVFFALLELNDIGFHDDVVENKYGFQLFSIDKRLKNTIRQNRSAYVQEDIEPNI